MKTKEGWFTLYSMRVFHKSVTAFFLNEHYYFFCSNNFIMLCFVCEFYYLTRDKIITIEQNIKNFLLHRNLIINNLNPANTRIPKPYKTHQKMNKFALFPLKSVTKNLPYWGIYFVKDTVFCIPTSYHYLSCFCKILVSNM